MISHGRLGARRDDRGYAMVTAVVVAALIVAVTGALVVTLTAGGASSARLRELYEARAAGASALEYLYARLELDADLLADSKALVGSGCAGNWIQSEAEPVPEIDSDTADEWCEFSVGAEVAVADCSSRLDPCWTMRYRLSDGSHPQDRAVVQAIVRFDCRPGGYCSVRRFQQELQRVSPDEASGVGHEWRRLDLAELPGDSPLR